MYSHPQFKEGNVLHSTSCLKFKFENSVNEEAENED